MKSLLLLLSCFLAFPSHSQDLPTKDGKVYYESIDSATCTKDQLYLNARRWFAKTFIDSKAVLQNDDKEAGEIIGKGFITFNWL